ncbi:MAG: VOC family protein [Pseudomonadota bacterium]
MIPNSTAPSPAPSATSIGHVHLRVSDLERSVAFYSDLLGFDVMLSGNGSAFLSAGGYHHHIGLNTWESLGATPPPPGHTGLFHTAFLYPDRQALGRVVARVLEAGVPLEGAADHGVSQAIYLQDPDKNGVELCWDRPKAEWPKGPDGELVLSSSRLNVQKLVAEALAPA